MSSTRLTYSSKSFVYKSSMSYGRQGCACIYSFSKIEKKYENLTFKYVKTVSNQEKLKVNFK